MMNFEKAQLVKAMRAKCPDLGDFVLRELADVAIETIDRLRNLKEVQDVTFNKS